MARLLVVYKTPQDAAAFDKYYFATHVPIAKKIPGLRRYEVSKAPVVQLAGAKDVYMVATLFFDDMAALQHAFASPEGQAAAADRLVFAPDDSKVDMLLFDEREV